MMNCILYCMHFMKQYYHKSINIISIILTDAEYQQ